ncbi:hypothetical protein EVAR_30328_1 [Eumeta japonica]|uniref:Uncharacterized protein n=1 Tax=Eumeta variegata TaxID=151549 RepID=A0A4C1WBT4_EUMVA|nr:hypothetical protein EVAR_30328_1 [Eumeta japonica]
MYWRLPSHLLEFLTAILDEASRGIFGRLFSPSVGAMVAVVSAALLLQLLSGWGDVGYPSHRPILCVWAISPRNSVLWPSASVRWRESVGTCFGVSGPSTSYPLGSVSSTRLITGDEKWITDDKNVRKKSWSKGKQASQNIAKPVLTRNKLMLRVSCDWKGIINCTTHTVFHSPNNRDLLQKREWGELGAASGCCHRYIEVRDGRLAYTRGYITTHDSAVVKLVTEASQWRKIGGGKGGKGRGALNLRTVSFAGNSER